MTESVLTLLPNGGTDGWDRMILGYDSSPIVLTFYSGEGKTALFSMTDAAVAGEISKITIAYRVSTNVTYGCVSMFYCITNTTGTNHETTGIVRSTEDPAWYYVDVTTNPETSAAWTWPDIDALQSGVRAVTSYGGQSKLYQFKVQVHYTPDTFEDVTGGGSNPGCSPGGMVF